MLALACSTLATRAGAEFVDLQVAQIDGAVAADAPGNAMGFGVFVRDSAVAADKLTLAQRLSVAREWDKSAEVYQEIVDKYADRVIGNATDAQGRTTRYASVGAAVQSSLAKWPADGRDAYTSRFGPAAQALLDAASDDDAKLHAVESRYFLTAAGRDAAVRLVEKRFESAEFASAALLADRLLAIHPDLGDAGPMLAVRAALAWQLAGEPDRANARLTDLTQRFGTAHANLGGQTDVALAEWTRGQLESLAKHQPHVDRTGADDPTSWLTAFGSPARDRLQPDIASGDRAAPSPALPIAPIFSQPLRVNAIAANPNENQPAVTASDAATRLAQLRPTGAATGIYPVVDRGQLFFQDNASVYAIDLASGQPLAGWLSTNGEANAGRFVLTGAAVAPPGAQMTLSLTDDRVFAVLGQPDMSGQNMQVRRFNRGNASGGDAVVVAIDRATGKQIWRSSATIPANTAVADIPKEAQAGSGPQPAQVNSDTGPIEASPVGTPMVVHDSVYVVAQSTRSQQFDDVYLLCLNAENGKPRWARHLVSANNRNPGWQYGMAPKPEPSSHLSYADGRVFVGTDAGAVAAVDAVDGSLEWLSVYPRPIPASAMNFRFGRVNTDERPSTAFSGNPLIVHNGKVFSLPVDAEHILVYDAATGTEVARVLTGDAESPRPGIDIGDVRTLVGIAPGSAGAPAALVVGGEQGIASFDVAKLIGGASPRDALRWARELKTERDRNTRLVQGRPALTQTSVLVPLSYGLQRLSLANGEVLEGYPRGGANWSRRDAEGPGNVLSFADFLVVAGVDRVTVYTDPQLVRRRLDDAIAREPSAPEPRIRYADAQFSTGDIVAGVKRLDEAIELLGGRSTMRSGAARAQLFATAMKQAGKLRDELPDGTSADAARGVFERALLAAETPIQRTTARIASARFERSQSDAGREVAAWQSILDDADARTLRVRGANDVESNAADVAESRIAELLASDAAAKQAYAPFEAQAKAAVEAAKRAGDGAALLAVAERYPNATAIAGDAYAAAADLLRNSGNFTQLRRLLRQQLADVAGVDANAAVRRTVLQKLADEYRRAGDLPMAIGRERTLAWDDQSLKPALAKSQSAWLDQLDARGVNAAFDAAPDPAAAPIVVEGVARILNPTDDSRRRLDRLVTLSPVRELKVFATPIVTGATPIATVPLPDVSFSANCSWLDADRLLLSYDDRVTVVDVKQAKVKWDAKLADLDAKAREATPTAGDAKQPPQPAAPASRDADVIVDTGLMIVERNLAPRAEKPAEAPDPDTVQVANVRRRVMNAQQARAVALQRARGRVVVREGEAAVGPVVFAPDPAPAEKAAEQIARYRVSTTSDAAGNVRIFLATTRGRVIAIDGETGKPSWSATLGDRAPFNLFTAGDFVALTTTDEGSSRFVVLDAADGSQIAVHRADPERGRIVNSLLSEEGVALVAFADRLLAIDLLADPNRAAWETTLSSPSGAPPLMQSTDAGHLATFGDRVLVMADVRTPLQAVRFFSLRDGAPIRVANAPSEQPVDVTIAARAGEDVASIGFAGRAGYLVGRHTITGFNPDDESVPAWVSPPASSPADASAEFVFLDASLQSLVTITAPVGRGEKAPAECVVRSYSRAKAGKSESGRLAAQFRVKFDAPSHDRSFVLINGGLACAGNRGQLVVFPATTSK
jgi:outer membrane protein assembly factor BamB